MVRGIDSFREWFRGYEEQYVIIGGTACDLLMTDEGLNFRATKDIALVLIAEAVDVAFGRRFWEFISTAGYEHRNKSTGEPQFIVSRTRSHVNIRQRLNCLQESRTSLFCQRGQRFLRF